MIFRDNSYEDRLDDFALLACQDYNLGNAGNWLFSFRGGLQGMRSRMSGLCLHREQIYEWTLKPGVIDVEHHVATALFCMDSALECTVFALNALGQAAAPADFRPVSDKSALRRVCPEDVVGKDAPPGWAKLFPTFRNRLLDSDRLVRLVQENHHVSKHRHHGFHGGQFRMDAPPGFFASRGLSDSSPYRFLLSPMKSVLIPKEPKLPVGARSPDRAAWTTLETAIAEFVPFLSTAIALALDDAKARITLPVSRLR